MARGERGLQRIGAGRTAKLLGTRQRGQAAADEDWSQCARFCSGRGVKLPSARVRAWMS